MITTERLKELIKQGAIIYCTMNNSKYIADFDLSTGYFTMASDCPIIVEQEITGHTHGYGFEQLFETKERAEWHCKMTAERTERFEPPMWEDIKDKYCFRFMLGEQFCDFCVCVSFHASWSNDILVESENGYIYFSTVATKENYIKACEIVRDLFNRGNK